MPTQEMKMSRRCTDILAAAEKITLENKSGRVCSVSVAIAIFLQTQSEAYQLVDEALNEIGGWSILDLQEALWDTLPRRKRVPKCMGSARKIIDAIIEYAQIAAIEDNRTEFTDYDLLRAVIFFGGGAAKVFREHRITVGALEEKKRMKIA